MYLHATGACSQPDWKMLHLQYVFMDMETYEETRIPRDESWAKYLKEGSTVALVLWNDKASLCCTHMLQP